MKGAKRVKIDIPYVVADRDRHGNLRIYYRRKGKPKVRLFETPGTQAFTDELEAATARSEGAPPLQSSNSAAPGTLRRLVIDYLDSAAFRILDPDTTQIARRGILEGICLSKLKNGVERGSLPADRMRPEDVEAIRDEKIDLPSAADGRVKAMRQLFKWAVKTRKMRTNPAKEVEYLGSGSDGHHTWTVDEVRRYWEAHPVGTTARLAIDILLFTGVRRSDAVRLGPQMERDGWLEFTEWKGSRSRVKKRGKSEGPKRRELPILPLLRETIAATPIGLRTYLVTSFGKPFTGNGFGNRMKKWCQTAGLPDECTAHGLRKAGATIAADNGATEHQLMAIYGWSTPQQAAVYTRKVNRARLAADSMHLLVPPENEKGSTVSHRNSGVVSHLQKKPIK